MKFLDALGKEIPLGKETKIPVVFSNLSTCYESYLTGYKVEGDTILVYHDLVFDDASIHSTKVKIVKETPNPMFIDLCMFVMVSKDTFL